MTLLAIAQKLDKPIRKPLSHPEIALQRIANAQNSRETCRKCCDTLEKEKRELYAGKWEKGRRYFLRYGLYKPEHARWT
jgi:hypothetical protein